MSSIYPTNQPITNAGIAAFLASVQASQAPRTARVNVRVKRSAELIDRMADDMLTFGEGMTRRDLQRAGYSEGQIDACHEAANSRAIARARN